MTQISLSRDIFTHVRRANNKWVKKRLWGSVQYPISCSVKNKICLNQNENRSVDSGATIPKFKDAVTYFLSKHTNVNFIVCSDDTGWCKHNRKKEMLKCVAEYGIHFSPGKSMQWDMVLLPICNHSDCCNWNFWMVEIMVCWWQNHLF